jgi:hypothetical protein
MIGAHTNCRNREVDYVCEIPRKCADAQDGTALVDSSKRTFGVFTNLLSMSSTPRMILDRCQMAIAEKGHLSIEVSKMGEMTNSKLGRLLKGLINVVRSMDPRSISSEELYQQRCGKQCLNPFCSQYWQI